MSLEFFVLFIFFIIVIIIMWVFVSRKNRKIALDLIEKEKEAKRKMYEIAILKELGDKMGYSLNIQKILEIIVSSLKQFVDYSSVSYMLLSPEKIVFKSHFEKSTSRTFVNQIKVKMLDSLATILNKDLKTIKIDELFSIFGPGVETGLDNFFVAETKKELIDRFKILSDKTDEQFKLLKIENKKSFLIKDKIKKENFTNLGDYIYTYQYKIFDFKKIAYLKNSLRRADFNVFKNFSVDNYFLTLMRSTVDTDSFKSILLSKHIIDKNLYSFQTYSFPLYLYPENDNEDFYGKKDRMPNLNMAIVGNIKNKSPLSKIFHF